jgi:hypothetical protein
LLLDDKEGKVGANQSEPKTIKIDIDLKKLKTDMPKSKQRKGVTKDIMPEDLFLMSNIPPMAHSKNISCDYFLVVKTIFSNPLVFGDAIPCIKVPVYICPVLPKEMFADMPSDFKPKEFEPEMMVDSD